MDRFSAARKLRLNQVARRLSVGITTVRRMIAYGDLPAVRIGTGKGVWVVAEPDLEQFLRDRSNRADEGGI